MSLLDGSFSIAALGVLVGGACGGSPHAAPSRPANVESGREAEPAPLAPGTSGFPGLDWGDTPDAVNADYPAAAGTGSELRMESDHGGRPAKMTFSFTDGRLVAVSVRYPERFASMDTCGEAFRAVRSQLDKLLGGSGEDNLAAYWGTDATEVILSCGQIDEDSDAAALSMSYEPRGAHDE